MRTLLEESPILNKAHEKYLAFTMDEELVDAYESHLKWKLDHDSALDSALTKGLKQGMEKGMRQTASRFKALGLSADLIQQATGLTLEEIDRLDTSNS